MPRNPLNRAVLEELEPRILYSADLAAVLGSAAGGGLYAGAQEQQLLHGNASAATTASPSLAAASHEIAFVDLAAPDAQALVAGLVAQRDNGRNIEVVTIAADQDGLELISQTLAGQQGITAVHLISHGSAGQVQLGTAVLNGQSALLRAADVAGWSTALSADADLLIYGCDVASSADGLALLQGLAALTGADVAASDDATGAAAIGGDWELEQRAGNVQTPVIVDLALQTSWNGLLSNDVGVNTTTSDVQNTSAERRGSQQSVALDSAGNYVVVWTSQNQDGAAGGVYARRFAFDGTPLTAEIAVNSATAGEQGQARVVSAADGRFAVAWTSHGVDGSAQGIALRFFNASGSSLTSEIAVNSSTSGAQLNPTLAINASTGAVVVAWEGNGVADSSGVFFRRFASDGTPMDPAEIQANLADDGTEIGPAVAMDSTGRVVVAYEVNNHMYFQRFDASAAAAGTRTQVDHGASNSTGAAIAMDAAGNFTLAYREQGVLLPGIWGRGFMADGSQRYTYYYAATGDADNSSIAMDGVGNFVVAYSKTNGADTDIYARKYNANGSVNGAAFVVNQHATGAQTAPSVALLARHDFVVAWSGVTSADADGVAARSFEGVAPVITSDGGGATASVGVAENTTVVTSVTATDADAGTTLSYSIAGGADAALFSIDPGTGALAFISAPDFESPGDAGADNTYEVVVMASDELRSDSQALSISVSDQAISSVSVGGASTVNSGSGYTLNLSANEDAASWTVNWGDGSIISYAGDPGSVSHVYTRPGFSFNILASATDAQGTVHPHQLLVPSYTGGDSVFRFAAGSGVFVQEFATGNGLNDPVQGIVGPDGLLYVSGEASNNVLRYNTTTGAYVDTFVAAASGGLNGAGGLAFGPDGNLYVASYGSNEVLRYDGTSGAYIDAFVGSVNRPYALAFGPDGQLYVGLYNNHEIRRFDASTGALLGALVSASSGGLTTPEQIAFGPDGDLYVASSGTDQVLRYNGSTGAFRDVFVAAASGGLDKPSGLAFGPDGHLYVSGEGTNSILRYNGSTGAFLGAYVTAGSGGLATPALMNFAPGQQVEVLAAPGNNAPTVAAPLVDQTASEDAVFSYTFGAGSFADADAGDTLSYSATLSSGAALPGWLSFNGATRSFSGMPGNGDVGSLVVRVTATDSASAAVHDDFALTVVNTNDAPVITSNAGGASGTVSVVENATGVTTVQASDVDTPAQTLTYSISGGADAARFNIVAGTGVLSFVAAPDFEAPADANTDNIYEVTVQASDGVVSDTQVLAISVTDQAISSVSVSGATTVSSGAGYSLNLNANEDATSWTVNWGDGSIVSYSGNPGSVSHVYTRPGFSFNILASATDAQGTVHPHELIVPTYSGGNNVMRFAPVTGAHLQTFGANGSNTYPTQAVIGSDGSLYVSEEGADSVRRYNASTGALLGTFVAAGSGGLDGAAGLAFGPDGHLYVASYNSNQVLRYDGASGSFIDAFIGSVSRPYGLSFAPDGRLYVSLYQSASVQRYDADTGALIDTFISAGSNGLLSPGTMVFGPDGHLYVNSFGGHEVQRYDTSTGAYLGAFVAAGAGGLERAAGLAFGPDGDLYVSSFGTNNVLRFDGTTGAYLDTYVAAGAGGLSAPSMLTFLPGQQVRVTDAVGPPASTADHYQLTEDQSLDATVASGWFDAAWTTRQYIGLNNSAGPQLTDTAVLVTLTAGTVDYSRLQSGGQDLRFVDDDGTVLDYEIETWNPAGTSLVWVRVPSIDAASTSDGFWAYYGNSAAASHQNPTGVWAGASAVVHLGSALTDVSPSVNPVSQTATTISTGAVGQARVFDGAGSTLNLGSAAAVDDLFLGGGAVSAWIRPTGWGEGGFGRIVSKASTTTATAGWALQLDAANQSLLFEYGFSGQVARWRAPVGAITLNDWQHVAVVYDASSTANVPQVYLNGVALTLSVSSAPSGTPTSDAALALTIGNHAVTPDRTFAGALDEFRAYNTTRTAAQVAAEFQAGSGALTTLGTPQAATPGVLNNDVNGDLSPMIASLVSGPSHAASFTLNADGTFNYVPVAQFAGADSFSYLATNGTGAGVPTTVNLSIAGTPDAPLISFGGGGATAATSVLENQLTVANLTASDPDGSVPSLVWSLAGGADVALFSINSASGALSFVAGPDFESPADAGADNVYDVVVQVSDGALTDTQALAVTVLPVNDVAPSIISDGGGATATVTVNEDASFITTVAATDADLPSQSLSYAITGGADAARFSIDAGTGALSFVAAPDFESPTDAGADNAYDVVVQVSDGSLTDTQSLSVTVLPVNDAAPGITSDGAGATASLSIDENLSFVTTVVATDADLPSQSLSFAIAGGSDAARFSVNSSTGVLHLISAPDFEAPADANADNVYEVVVQVSDGTLLDTQALTVVVQPVNDHAPVLTNYGGASSQAVAVNENLAALTTLTAADADLPGQSLSYSIIAGADAALFTVDAATGSLSFIAPPDFERPSDADGNNLYYVTVQVSDGIQQDFVDLRFSVQDVNESAVSALVDSDAAVNQVPETSGVGTVVGITLQAVDADASNNAVSYSLTDDDGGRFAVDSQTGVVTLARTLGEEAQRLRTIAVRAESSDGSFSTASFGITISPINNHAPSIMSDGGGSTATASIDEGEPFVALVVAADGDLPQQALQFSIVGGADAGLFSIDSTSGVLQMRAPVDFEAPTDADRNGVYEVTVAVDDGAGLQDTQTFGVQVRNVNEAPQWINNRLDIAEGGVVTPGAAALDVDSPASALYFEVSGLSGGRFERVTAPGVALSGFTQNDLLTAQIRFVADGGEAAPAYQLSLSDETFRLPAQAAAVNFTPVNDAPEFSGASTNPVSPLLMSENETAVTVLEAVDVDNASSDLRFAIVGGADAALFRVDTLTGALVFAAPPDHEAPQDANADGRYEIAVAVSDGLAQAIQSLSVQVTDVDEAPVVTRQALLVSSQGLTLVLKAHDPEGASDSMVYEVLATRGGHFELAGTDGKRAALFTQAQVDGGQVLFVADGSGVEPSFALALSDGVNRIELREPDVVRQVDSAVAEAPASAAAQDSIHLAAAQSPQTAATAPAAQAGEPARVLPPTAAVDAANTSDPNLVRWATFAQGDTASVVGPQARGGSTETLAANARVEVTAGGDGFWVQSIAALQLVTDEPVVLREAHGLDLFGGRSSSVLAQAMDAARLDERLAQGGPLQVDSASAVLVSSGLSVGYVLWLARGGALVASLMSSVPAWASVDPLPVLSQARRGRDGEAGDDAAEGDEIDPVDRLFSRARRLIRPPAVPSAPPTASAARTEQTLREENEWAS